jgi:hypothetical protein
VTVIEYEARSCAPADGVDGVCVVGARLIGVLRERELTEQFGVDSPIHRIGRLLLGEAASTVPPSSRGLPIAPARRTAVELKPSAAPAAQSMTVSV